MKNKTWLYFTPCIFLFVLCAAGCAPGVDSANAGTALDQQDPPLIQVENLSDFQEITEGVPAFFRITAAKEVTGVQVSSNGNVLGLAEISTDESQFSFSYSFEELGAHDLQFSAFTNGSVEPLASVSHRVEVVANSAPAHSRLFNRYILKSVNYLSKNYGLLGYNINAQNTHSFQYYKYGTFNPTKGGLTMCVAGVLEVIVTAFDIYARETGNPAIYNFLPFKSWSTLHENSIKAHIWVNSKLRSSGTADAISKFGIGEKVKFRNLEPGGFININRTNGSGHAVVFLSFIDAKGRDVAKYGSQVVGFRYFGAQGKGKKGEGGLSYRHAFFSKHGCPNVPFKRDCDVIFSDDSRMLNVGQMLHPSDWKRTNADDREELDPLSPEDQRLISSPLDFNGLTTDD